VALTALMSVQCALIVGITDSEEAALSSADGGGDGASGAQDGDTNDADLDGGPDAPCIQGGPGSVEGVIYDPTGTFPIHGVRVYALGDTGPPPDLAHGVKCIDRCGGAQYPKKAISTTVTRGDGYFLLPNIPADTPRTLVFQAGLWRRSVTVTAKSCSTISLPKNMSTFARNSTEGDLPHIAVATGASDPVECLLRRLGVDDAEFMPGGSGTGRIHLFRSNGLDGETSPFPDATLLWNNSATLALYDMVILPCEGSNISRLATPVANLVDYANKGGRLFTTHYGFPNWITNANSVWKSLFTGNSGGETALTLSSNVVTTTAKGNALATWLSAVGASSVPGVLPLQSAALDIASIDDPQVSPFIITPQEASASTTPEYVTFDTPTNSPGATCGSVVFTDFHLVASGSGGKFPSACSNAPLTAQEKVLVWVLFDLETCPSLN